MSDAREQDEVWHLREAVRRGDTSARDQVARALAAEREHRALGAFVSVEPELALAEADAADRRLAAAGRRAADPVPPLLGIATAHKDLVAQRGHRTTHGSRAVPHIAAERDDPIAAVVRAAGAISIGKTQVPEFGIAGYSENSVAAPARNPYDPTLTAGGSSGGTAAAVAAGIVPGAIASDAGGSIRIPSAACGLIGLKPGRGVVPADAAGGPVDEHGAPRMGVSGPIARTARDAALLYDALFPRRVAAGAEPTVSAVERAEELTGLRIGVSLDSPFAGWIDLQFSSEARAALDAGIAALDAAGHIVEPAVIAYDPRYPQTFTTVWTAGLARLGLTAEAEERLGDLARMFLERTRATSPAQLAESVSALRAFAVEAARAWAAYDAVLTPALASIPPRIGAFHALGPEGDYRLQCEWAPQTSMVNVAGAAAVVVPAHMTEPAEGRAAGLPMGVQLIGRAGDEARLLQLAAQIADYAPAASRSR